MTVYSQTFERRHIVEILILSTARQNMCTVYTYVKENGTRKVAKTKTMREGKSEREIEGREKERGRGVRV